jgi:two-component system, cell cycle sensor histidine kinase and response regulator CckA
MSGGYSVLQASEGGEAVRVAQQHGGPIHLIISDVILPGTSGPEAVAQVQAIHPETKALFVSGYAEVPLAQVLVSQGSVLLRKPVSRGDLMRKVDELLHLSTPTSKNV